MALWSGACHGSKQQPGPPPPAPPKPSFRALDAQQQRLVADYEPVSRALTGYELAYRDRKELAAETSALRHAVAVLLLVRFVGISVAPLGVFVAAAVAGVLIGMGHGGFDAPARGLMVW